jgi:hypothetical protein
MVFKNEPYLSESQSFMLLVSLSRVSKIAFIVRGSNEMANFDNKL